MEIRIDIDILVLHNVGSLPRERFQTGLQSELTRLFRDQGIPTGLESSRVEQHTSTAGIPPTSAAEAHGAHLARQLYTSFR